jgi:acyl-CoA reductase-like NAD-dependent aldehyde dehydrogenase
MIGAPDLASVNVIDCAPVIVRSRAAQRLWAETRLDARLKIIRKLRDRLARAAPSLREEFPKTSDGNFAERLAAEIIPLAEAVRFLEHEARSILAPRRLPLKHRPFWLRGIDVEERREPLGVVLIMGPANYPLFLPGVQTLQALAAGNAVIAKPGVGGGRVMRKFQQMALKAGVPNDAFVVLDEEISLVKSVLAQGVDKVVLTGSVETGKSVYREVAENLIPVTLELSGCDPVFVLAGANLERAAAAIAFGLRWNGGNTCIAPRRVFVAEGAADVFESLLGKHCSEAAQFLPISRFANQQQALTEAGESPYTLGASVFGEPAAARAFASRVKAGMVVVNDMIMPSADPRVTFEGRGLSGFGATRGAEGLRQFTVPKVVVVQKRRRLWHFEPLPQNAEELFSTYLAASHMAGWRDRLLAGWRLMCALPRTRVARSAVRNN